MAGTIKRLSSAATTLLLVVYLLSGTVYWFFHPSLTEMEVFLWLLSGGPLRLLI